MTIRKPLGLILATNCGTPVGERRLRHWYVDGGDQLEFHILVGHTAHGLPVVANKSLFVRAFKMRALRQFKTILLRVKTRGEIPDGLQHGEYRLVLNAATATCPMPNGIESSGGKIPDPWHCSQCDTLGVSTENIEGYPASKCPKGHGRWWNTTCYFCGKVIDSRAPMTKCNHCGYYHCPYCGACSRDCPALRHR